MTGRALPASSWSDQLGPLLDRGDRVGRARCRAPAHRRRPDRSGTARPRPHPARRRSRRWPAAPPRRAARCRRAAPRAPTSGRRPAWRQVQRLGADLAAQQLAEQPGAVRTGAGRVGERPAQPRLPPQQVGDGEEVVGGGGHRRRLRAADVRVEALGRDLYDSRLAACISGPPRSRGCSGTGRRCPCGAPRRRGTRRRSCWPGRPRSCRPRCAARARWWPARRRAAPCRPR